MKLMDISEKAEEHKDGTFMAVRFNDFTKRAIGSLMDQLGVVNPVPLDTLHTTIISSRVPVPELEPKPINRKIYSESNEYLLEVWTTGKGKRALVLSYSCPYLVNRFNEIMKKYPQATTDYDSYKVHVTLSYDIGDTEYPLGKIMFPDSSYIRLEEEYVQPLDLDYVGDDGLPATEDMYEDMKMGFYVGYELAPDSRDKIYEIMEGMNLTKPVKKENLHVTVLSSPLPPLPLDEILYTYRRPVVRDSYPVELREEPEMGRVIALYLQSEELEDEGKYLRKLQTKGYCDDDRPAFVVLQYNHDDKEYPKGFRTSMIPKNMPVQITKRIVRSLKKDGNGKVINPYMED